MAFNKDINSLFDRYVNRILSEAPAIETTVGGSDGINAFDPNLPPEQRKIANERRNKFIEQELQKQGQEVASQKNSMVSGEEVDSYEEENNDDWLNTKTAQPKITPANTSSSFSNTNIVNTSTQTGGGSKTLTIDRDVAGQQAAAERAKQKRETGSQGASRIVSSANTSSADSSNSTTTTPSNTITGNNSSSTNNVDTTKWQQELDQLMQSFK